MPKTIFANFPSSLLFIEICDFLLNPFFGPDSVRREQKHSKFNIFWTVQSIPLWLVPWNRIFFCAFFKATYVQFCQISRKKYIEENVLLTFWPVSWWLFLRRILPKIIVFVSAYDGAKHDGVTLPNFLVSSNYFDIDMLVIQVFSLSPFDVDYWGTNTSFTRYLTAFPIWSIIVVENE